MPPECGSDEEEFLSIWSYASTQWRVGGMGAVGLDYPAILDIAERMGCEVDEVFIRRLRAIEIHELERFKE